MTETGADVAVGNYDFIHRIDEEKEDRAQEREIVTKTGYEAQYLFMTAACAFATAWPG